MNKDYNSELAELLVKLETYMDEPGSGSGLPSAVLNLVEEIITEENEAAVTDDTWHRYLELTRYPAFLTNLENIEERYRWAETTFKVIKKSHYTFEIMMNQRAAAHPNKTFLVSNAGSDESYMSYRDVNRMLQATAAGIINLSGKTPRVAIYSDNTPEGAVLDLACLTFDIFVAPFHVHFGMEILQYLIGRFGFNIIFTDTPERVETLLNLKVRTGYDFVILYKGDYPSEEKGVANFFDLARQNDYAAVVDLLKNRKKFEPDEISTVMFTSGSTGMPKSVAFSSYNLITKRFARGAVLPKVGNDEVLVSYLPLFHTFGRYLELIGMLYWGGTYVFANKSDINSLIKLMQIFNPTGFISIPLRWKQIYDVAHENYSGPADAESRSQILKETAGNRLSWGISAAGYLEPVVFKYFNSMGVELCSGFGMTEGTGGISMTLPGGYIRDSVGVPLPGIKLRFSEDGELQVSGPYIAKYFEEFDNFKDKEYWLNTGDLFKQDDDGNLYLIDRLKDIYKNSRGQTIAPAFIEKKFENIPGLKKVFLVGDKKAYNTMLIVPDPEESFVRKAESQNKLNDYFSSLISAVNNNLNPYERIVKFKVIHRDFETGKGELTAKGSFKRKVIEHNFRHSIDELYRKSDIQFKSDKLKIIVPLWLVKDLGITESDLEYSSGTLFNKQHNKKLSIAFNDKTKRIRIGDFEYIGRHDKVELGVFINQPVLWIGNPALFDFAKCRANWETPFDDFSSQIFTADLSGSLKSKFTGEDPGDKLTYLHKVVVRLLFGNDTQVEMSLLELEDRLPHEEHNYINLICRRIEALSLHPKFKIRSHAYKILLLNQPNIDYNRYLPSFINSGLPFLNKKVITGIVFNEVEGFRLEALRKRLKAYREGLSWPLPATAASQFKRILELLVSFVKQNPSLYATVRAELISWILHKEDRSLSVYARKQFNELSHWYEGKFKLNAYEKNIKNWKDKLVYLEGIDQREQKRIEKILAGTTFLKEAFALIFESNKFNLANVENGGIFISKLSYAHKRYLYRISINTVNHRHYDLVIFIKPDITIQKVQETIYFMIKIADSSGGASILPKLGNFRSDHGIVSFAYINDLTVWERVRLLTSTRSSYNKKDYEVEWEVIFRRGIAAFFTVLKNSGYTVIPGNMSPSNVVVPEPYFKEGTRVLSLAGWKRFNSAEDIMMPLYNNFYLQTYAHYPWSREFLRTDWIFDACLESFGKEKGLKFLREYLEKISQVKNQKLKDDLENFLAERENAPCINSYIISAVKNYEDWKTGNPSATHHAKTEIVENLSVMYRMERFTDAERFYFFRKTYFEDLSGDIKILMDKFIKSVYKHPGRQLTDRPELVELQHALVDKVDRNLLNRILFPRLKKSSAAELVTSPEIEEQSLILKTKVKDSFGLKYIIRTPVSPYEIGSLQKLFILDNYPIKIDGNLKYILMFDGEEEENVVGGVCYRMPFPKVARIEGIEIVKSYRGRGLGGTLLDDFCERLNAEGIGTVTTHFFLRAFFERFDFKMDSRWGGLVRFLR